MQRFSLALQLLLYIFGFQISGFIIPDEGKLNTEMVLFGRNQLTVIDILQNHMLVQSEDLYPFSDNKVTNHIKIMRHAFHSMTLLMNSNHVKRTQPHADSVCLFKFPFGSLFCYVHFNITIMCYSHLLHKQYKERFVSAMGVQCLYDVN